ncbi:Uncharacterized protein FKW44_016816, partial [Caligus rogercresseyi]
MSRVNCNLEFKNQSYNACMDDFNNASFLSNPTRSELLMTRAQTLVQHLINSVDEMINDIDAEIAKIQELRCNTIKHAQALIQEGFNSLQPDEEELRGFSSELQFFISDLDTFQECVPGTSR